MLLTLYANLYEKLIPTQNEVRLEMKTLLGIRMDQDIVQAVKKGHLADPKDAEDFEDGRHPGPTLEPLQPFWDTAGTLWNAHLAELFADHLIRKLPGRASERETIVEHFLQRIATLRRVLLDEIPSDEKETTAEADLRRQEKRKASLRQGRERERRSRVSFDPPALRSDH